VSGSAICAVSPDGQWNVLGLNLRKGEMIDLDYVLTLWGRDGKVRLQDLGNAHAGGTGPPLKDQVAGMAFSADSRLLYVVDEAARLHVYALDASIKAVMLEPEQYGYPHDATAYSPLLVPRRTGIAISYHSGTRVAWLPLVTPKAVAVNALR
jgi:hypothetical protein